MHFESFHPRPVTKDLLRFIAREAHSIFSDSSISELFKFSSAQASF